MEENKSKKVNYFSKDDNVEKKDKKLEQKIEMQNAKNTSKALSIISWLLRILVILAIAIAIYFVGRRGDSLFKTRATVINEQFENKSELVTQTDRVTVLQDTSKDRELFNIYKIPKSTSRLVFTYDVIVRAGIDFSKVSFNSEDVKNKTLTLNIPHAEIFSADVDDDSRYTIIDQENIFTNINFEEEQDAVRDLKSKAKEKAIRSADLTKYAEENAKKLIENMVKTNSVYKDYKIEYKFIGD